MWRKEENFSRVDHKTLFQFYNYSIADLATNSCVIKRATNHKGITGSMGVVSGAFHETKLSVSASFVTEPPLPQGGCERIKGWHDGTHVPHMCHVSDPFTVAVAALINWN